MGGSIFREKSMKRVSSPEQLNDYVKVTNPGIWMILIIIILLLIGLGVWSIFGSLDTVISVGAQCRDGVLTCYIKEEDAVNVKMGMKVMVDGIKYELAEVSEQSVSLGKDTDAAILHAGKLTEGERVYTAWADAELEDGIYKAAIITESIHPIIFVLN